MENKFSPEIIKAVLETSVKENLTENVKIDYSPDVNNYRISVWKKGISAGAIIRTKKQGISKWNHFMKSLEKYCCDLKKSVDTI